MIPHAAGSIVPRSELVARLDDPSWRLGVVSAPAGFGKSMLLSSWALDRVVRPAWFSCDPGDAEPLQFWKGLIASVGTRWPGVGDDATVVLGRSTSEEQRAAISLANDLADVATPPVLVIDDLHLAKPTPSVLSAFIGALPPEVRLIIGSRKQSPFSLARRRLSGDLLELRTEDLRFSTAEAAALLGHHAIELTATDVVLLQEMTEGWPAALQLAAMSLRRASERERFLGALGSTEGPMADFLVSEVLAGLPDDWIEFLLVTSVLDEFDVALCERMTGRADAGEILHELLAADLFVVALDDAGEWYRYHHLFGAFMRARLRAQGAERLRHVHAHAVKALEDEGHIVPAIRHAIANDNGTLGAEIARRALGRSMHPIDVDATAAAARLWLDECAADTVATDPVTVLEIILALASTSGSDVARWLELVAEAHPHPSAEVTGYLQGTWGEYHLGHGHVGEALRCLDLAMTAFDGAPPNQRLLPLIYPAWIRAQISAGDIDAARATLDRIGHHSVGHTILDDVRLPGMRAWVAFLDGDLNDAMRLAEQALRRADEMSLGYYEPGRMFAGVTIAGVHAERANDPAAEAALAMASRSADLAERPWFRCMVLMQQAAVARTTGDAAAAAMHLALARLTMSHPSVEVEQSFALEAARQAVRFQPWTAAPMVDELGESAAAMALRAHLALDSADQHLAAQVIELMPTPSTTRQRVEYGMLRALAAHDTDSAIVHVESALAAAGPEGYVRSIIEAGTGVPELLAAFTPGLAHQAYTETLRTASASVIPPSRSGGAERLIDPLSDREIVVLRYLSSRLTNHEIAEALYISINTMKTHVRTIYRKLGVCSRVQAVEAGRRKRLI